MVLLGYLVFEVVDEYVLSCVFCYERVFVGIKVLCHVDRRLVQ